MILSKILLCGGATVIQKKLRKEHLEALSIMVSHSF